MILYFDAYMELLHFDERILMNIPGVHLKAVFLNGKLERVEQNDVLAGMKINYWPEDITPAIRDEIKSVYDLVMENAAREGA